MAAWWVVAVLLAAACARANVSGGTASAPAPVPRTAESRPTVASPSATSRPAAAADPRTFEALLGDHFFDPQVIAVKVGATVVWRNSSGVHNVTARDDSFRSPTLGDAYSHTFTRPGRYPFFCTFHPAEMRGEVVVEPD